MNDPLAKLRITRVEEMPVRRSSGGGVLRTLFYLLVIALLVGGGAYAAWVFGWVSEGLKFGDLTRALQPRVEVRRASLQRVAGRSADATVVASGYLESRRQAKIGARAPGRIEVVNVEEGSRVTRGEVLAVLEHADLDASLAASKASLAQAEAQVLEQKVMIANSKRSYDRALALIRSKSIADEEFDQAKYEYDAAMARLASLEATVGLAAARVREAEQMKENMFVRAPFDGTVISKDGEVGESILPGGMGEASGRGSVVTIADLDHLEVDCDVKEDFISRVKVGQKAEVAVDAVPKHRYQGTVRKVIPMGDRARATIKVKVAIDDVDERLFPDMSGTVYFLPDQSVAEVDSERERLFCGSQAIVRENDKTYVWHMRDDQSLTRQEVTIGELREDRVEILKGLTGNEVVVIVPADGEVAEGALAQVAE